MGAGVAAGIKPDARVGVGVAGNQSTVAVGLAVGGMGVSVENTGSGVLIVQPDNPNTAKQTRVTKRRRAICIVYYVFDCNH